MVIYMHGYVARICTSFIDVPGRTSIAVYFSGCSLRCKDCQNPELWDRSSGKLIDVADVVKKVINHPLAESVVFLGGEPTDQIEFLEEVCQQIKACCEKEIVLYSGREFEFLPRSLLEYLDLIICGPYRPDLLVDGWPASSNQRVFKKKNEVWTC
jgi:anaerobic ribonucleoside-triphosphate reductase activating protein